MSKEVLRAIRELNQKNHGINAEGSEGTAEEFRTRISNMQTKLATDLNERVTQAMSRFRSRLTDLADSAEAPVQLPIQEQAPDSSSLQEIQSNSEKILSAIDSLQTPQEPEPAPAIGSEKIESLFEQTLPQLQEKFEGVFAQFSEGLAKLNESEDSKPEEATALQIEDIENLLQKELKAVADQITASLSSLEPKPEPSAEASSEIESSQVAEIQDFIKSELSSQLSSMQEAFSQQIQASDVPAGGAASEASQQLEIDGLAKSLKEIEQQLPEISSSQEKQLAAIRESIENIEIPAVAAHESAESSSSSEESQSLADYSLLQEIQQQQTHLVELLQDLKAEASQATSDSEVQEGKSSDNPEMTQQIQEIHEILQKQNESHSQEEQMLKGIRKDMSLLVHSINTHIEDSKSITEKIAEHIETALENVNSTAGPSNEAIGEDLVRALSELNGLKSLPDRITSILSAADEVNQYGLNAALQEAADDITKRIELVMEANNGETEQVLALDQQLVLEQEQ